MAQAATDRPEFLTPHEVRAILRVSDQTLRNWRAGGNGPPWTRVEGVIRYPADELDRWLEERTVR